MKAVYKPTGTEEKYGKLYIVVRRYIVDPSIYNLVDGDLIREQELTFFGKAPTKEQIENIKETELKDIEAKREKGIESIRRAKNPPEFLGKRPITEEKGQKALANLNSVITELKEYYS